MITTILLNTTNSRLLNLSSETEEVKQIINMAEVSLYYNEVYVLEDDPFNNTAVQDATSSPPSPPPRVRNTPISTRKKRTVLSLFDSEGYAIPDPTVTPPDTPKPPAAKKVCKMECSNKRKVLTVCAVTFVLVGAIVGIAFFMVSETSMSNTNKTDTTPNTKYSTTDTTPNTVQHNYKTNTVVILQFENATYRVTENSGTVKLNVHRQNGLQSFTLVRWKSIDLTAMNGKDYTGGEEAIFFEANEV